MPKISFASLPVEVIERIIAKCEENDAEILESQTTSLLKSVHGRDDDEAQDGENGWETESEDGNAAQASAEAIKPVGRDDKRKCLSCGENHLDPKPRLHDKLPSPPVLAIHQLAVTSKDLRELTLPLIYMDLDFEDRSNGLIQRWMDLIMPKYAQFVKRLWIRVSLGENAEVSDLSWDDGEDPEGFQQQNRYVLTLKLLAHLPNLTEIDIDLPSPANLHLEDPTRTLQSDIASRGVHLTSLSLCSDSADGQLSTSVIAPLLEQLPKLQEVHLFNVDRQGSDGPVLRDVIAALKDLQAINLEEVMAIDDSWAKADWQSSLKVISLDDCQLISSAGVEALLDRHSRTLRGINLIMTPNEDSETLNNGAPYHFPQLWNLSLESSDMSISFLQRFMLCPKLGRLELSLMEEIGAKELSDLISKNKTEEQAGFPALKELVLSSDWAEEASDPEMETLELTCFANGINLMHEDPDSEDEFYSDQELLDELSEMDDDDEEGDTYWGDGVDHEMDSDEWDEDADSDPDGSEAE